MQAEKPDPGAVPVQVKADPDAPQTLQHFDFVDSDEESPGMRKMKNRSTGQCSHWQQSTSTSTTHINTAHLCGITGPSNSNCGDSQAKKMKCKHAMTKAAQCSATDKKPICDNITLTRKLPSKGHCSYKTEPVKDAYSEDGQILTPQSDTAATPSPMKDPHVSGGLGSAEGSESTFRPTLLDEVLSEKKLLMMRSPSVIKFLKRHQNLLVKRSSNILQMGGQNMLDKPPGKS